MRLAWSVSMMIVSKGPATNAALVQSQRSGAVLEMRRDDDDGRTAGSMPVWRRQETAADATQASLAEAATDRAPEGMENGLSYAQADRFRNDEPEEFTFGDLLDMVNPLQHIPLVSVLYREVTGDSIRPVAQVVGGSLYGGVAGGGAALANVIIEEETGRDIAGNVAALVLDGETPTLRAQADTPETRLEMAAAETVNDDTLQNLPGSALSFADLGNGKHRVYERVATVDDRTAGTIMRIYTLDPNSAVPTRM